MKVQTRSETFKPGEPLDHQMAVEKVFWFLENNKLDYRWIIDIDVPMNYVAGFIKQLPANRTYYGHTYDLGIYSPVFVDDKLTEVKLLAVIEINGNIGYKYHDATGRIKRAYATKHSKKKQQQNDKINKNYLETYYPDVKYITVLKEEINGDIEDKDQVKNTTLYLQRELVDFIK